jgi:outer membrane receptor protein involved in Fe transport
MVTAKRVKSLAGAMLSGLFSACLASPLVIAQEAEQDTTEEVQNAPAASATEKIQVTGSRLKQADLETSAPITIIDSSQIEQSGLSSLGDIFRNSATLSPIGNFSGSSQYVSSGASSINLLGLGASRTLVLLNGKRLPSSSALNAVNVDNIPSSIIDRIEVLSGGASAVYGADAVGGVINIITKTDVDGTNVSVYLARPSKAGGETSEVSISQGAAIGETARVIIAGGYRTRQAIDKRNRDLSYAGADRQYTASNPPKNGYSFRPVTSVVGEDGNSSLSVGNWTPSSNCPAENQVATVPSRPDDVYCAGLRKEVRSELIPYKEEYYLHLNTSFELTPSWTLSGLAGYSRSYNRVIAGNYLSSSDPYTNSPMLLSKEKAVELGVVDASQDIDFVQIMAPVREMPNREYRNLNETAMGAAYLDGYLGSGWNIQAGLSYAKGTTKRTGINMQNSSAFRDIVYNTQHPEGADPKFIAFDPNRDSNLLNQTLTDLHSKNESSSFTVDVFASKEVFELSGGSASIGVGASYMYEDFSLESDPRDEAFNEINEPVYTGTFAPKGSGDRNMKSAYVEMLAPIAKWAELSGALRFDRYSDFDDVFNYGLGLKVATFDFLTLRGRAASSYKAPPLSYIHQEGGGGYYSVRDENWCQRENDEGRVCESSNPRHYIYVENPGNNNLDPEVGLNYTAGFILEPLAGLSIVADHYWINLEKTFKRDDLQDVLDDWYESNGTDGQSGFQGANLVNLDNDGIVTSIKLPYRNLGQLKMRGVDAKLKYDVKLGAFGLGFRSEYFRLLSYKEKDTDKSPLREIVGYFGLPPWRLNNSLQLSYEHSTITIGARTIAAQSQDPEYATADSIDSRVGDFTAYDLVYAVQASQGIRLQLGVNNVLDQLGGVEDGNSLKSEDVVSSSLYSYYGRTFFARLSADL